MSRILASTIALTQFTVTGPYPGVDYLFTFFPEALSRHAFQPIDQSTDIASVGWVNIHDSAVSISDNPGLLWLDKFLFFSLRQDVRKIPTAVLNQEIKKEEDAFLAEHQNLRRIPKAKRAEIKELVTLRLLAKTLPVPAVNDVAWNTETGTLYFFSNSGKTIDLFTDIFHKTFPEYHLTPVVPYHRAQQAAVAVDLVNEITAANQSNSDNFLSLIRDNSWIGRDFLLWLLSGCNSDSAAGFSAWVDNKLVMVGPGAEGVQKITVAGDFFDRMPAIKTALLDGKQITSATLFFKKEENQYQLTLVGETFSISGFKTPQVRLERQIDDTLSEMQAVTLEKMHLINTGMGFLNDLLSLFLVDRLTVGSWSERQKDIQAWMEEA